MSDASKPVEIFLSYAPEDESWCLELEKHLSLMKREGLITTWHKRQIVAGTDSRKEMDQRLSTARVILLLLSVNFVASDYCYGIEMQRAMERHEEGSARVIPIVLRPIDDWQSPPFGKLKPLPSNGVSVTEWSDSHAAFADVAKGIRVALKGMPHLAVRTGLASVGKTQPLFRSLFLKGAFLVSVCLLSVILHLFGNDISLLAWGIDFILVIAFVALLVRTKTKAQTSVKARERRVFLWAPLGFLPILGSSLFKEVALKQEIGNEKRKREELEKQLEKGLLTQLRMKLLPDALDTRPLEDALSNHLKIPVSSSFGESYTGTINALAKGDVEVAWLGAFSYLRARSNYGAKVILCNLTQDRQKTYQSYIIANAKANIRQIEDLKGKRFALVDFNSTSGRLIPLYKIKKAGLDPEKDDITTFYADTHEKVLDKVLSGEAHAGAVASHIYHAFKGVKFREDELVIVGMGKEKEIDIPKGPLVVRKDVHHYDELRIADAFLTIEEIDPSINNTMHIGGFVKITHKSYAFLLDIAKELNISISELDK